MPQYFGFQLSLELSNIPTVTQGAVAQIIAFARYLRKSGSDIVIEVDLAEVFGRGRISPQLESSFTDMVKIQGYKPLHNGCEIELHSGPGPTVARALRDPEYLATTIQLSFLGWTHDREQIASMIASAIRKRYEAGVPGALPDPGYEGVMNTLAACSSQSSNFNWSYYTEKVQRILRTGIPEFQYSADYIRLSPALLLGAMDFLYKVQTLPEDRKIVVSNEIGSITLIIWAHYILGLNVVITGEIKSPIIFGGSSNPQVAIEWTKTNRQGAGELFYPAESNDPGPEIRLLDADMSVQLMVQPSSEDRDFIRADDRHPLLGWGSVYFRRLINRNLLVEDDDDIYKESVSFITAMAINASQRLDRDMDSSERRSKPYDPKESTESGKPQPRPMTLEFWRVLDAAELIFNGIKIDRAGVQSYVDFYRDKFKEENLPNTFGSFISRVEKGTSFFSPAVRFMNQVKFLAQIVLIFAHVADVKKCAHMPLRITDYHPYLASQSTQLYEDPNARALVRPEEIFHAVSSLLSNSFFDPREDMPLFTSRVGKFLFLVSDFGWSVFFDTLCDKDPAEVTPELICVAPGTPTNIKTEEQKHLLRDGVSFQNSEYPSNYPLFTGATYLPRCAARVPERKNLWTSRAQEFELTLYYPIKPSAEWCTYKITPNTEPSRSPEIVSTFEECCGFREMQAKLWQTYSTPDYICTHPVLHEIEEPIKLGPDAITLLGWSNVRELIQAWPQRILILLTRGDRHIRWLAILEHCRKRGRELMLRTPNCCDECALKHVVSQPGKWILVL
jgi:hypothetical protein